MMNEQLRPYFTHLHLHSQFSLLQATPSIEQLVAQAQADRLRYLALTDSRALYGAVAFSRACTAVHIQPIIGLHLAIQSPIPDALSTSTTGEIVLLARDRRGYRSLCQIASHLQTNSSTAHGLPWEILKTERAGLIGIDAGRGGWLAHYLQMGQPQTASRYLSLFGGLFAENGYVGVTLNRPEERPLAVACQEMASRFGVPIVAQQPIYTLSPDEVPLLRLLAAIDQNIPVEAVPAESLPTHLTPDVHWLSPEEMAARYAEMPEALTAVREIVQQCEPALPDGTPIWPILPLPASQTADEALRTQATAGLHEKYGQPASHEVTARLERELAAITRHGFAPLFLLVADITRFARQTAVPFNTRGSVANSLVAFCIGISNVDPIANDLLFERFLNPARANLPDIDLDFCSRRRDDVLNYVRQTYGEDRVALVATINTLQPKSAVRETAKAYGLPAAALKQLTKLLPREWHPDPRRRHAQTVEEVVARLETPRHAEIVRQAFRLVGFPHHMSIHPGGIVIAPTPLTDYVPVQMAPKGFLITQYDHRDVERIGLPKIDLLGIRALTVLANTAVLLQTAPDAPYDLAGIPLADEKTAVLLQSGDSIGVFQCESTGAQRTLRQLRVRTVADLAVANAFFKPGPATGGMANAFIRRYRGQEAVSYLHPTLEPILQRTKGVLLFQEQVLRIAVEVADLSWAEADHLRRGMSKFQADEMAQMQERFVAGCQRKSQFTAVQADTLWEQVMAFAGYGFNQGHATAYADVSYRSAYLKAHYPAQFLAARLAEAGGFHHPAIYMAEAQRLGIVVRPPHVNVSGRKFTLTYEEETAVLWMGLGQVRNLRRTTIRALVAKRPFASVADLLRRVPMQAKEVDHLIRCGALDGLGESRAAMLAEAEHLARAGSARQMSFAFALETAVLPETVADRLTWEKQLLGQPVSANPVALKSEQTADDVPLALVHRLRNVKTTVAGCRLPGWTGGRGVYVGDGHTFIEVRLPKNSPRLIPWEPVRFAGLWREDEWGGGFFEVTKRHVLP